MVEEEDKMVVIGTFVVGVTAKRDELVVTVGMNMNGTMRMSAVVNFLTTMSNGGTAHAQHHQRHDDSKESDLIRHQLTEINDKGIITQSHHVMRLLYRHSTTNRRFISRFPTMSHLETQTSRIVRIMR